MYRFEVIQYFKESDSKFLTSYACNAHDAKEALQKAQKWAEETFPHRRVFVAPIN